MRMTNEPPARGSISIVRPKKYRAVNSELVSACQTLSGVAAM
jgi:hypothetical protein